MECTEKNNCSNYPTHCHPGLYTACFADIKETIYDKRIRPKSPRIKLPKAAYRKLCEYLQERDGHCLICGNPNNLTPAHVIRRSHGGNDSPNNMICACVTRADGAKGCHMRLDQYEIDLPEEIKDMLSKEPERL
ncbi:MAG: HNH endonuclease [Planctomycetota bacterium]|jgi:hypothetical protein